MADARQIHDPIGLDVLKVRSITGQRMQMPVRLGPGESDAIRLFLQLKAHVLLTDDGKAIKASRMLKIPFTISPNIVLDLYERKDLTVKEATQALEKHCLFGRYSPDIIAEVLLKLRWEKDDA